MRNIERGSIKHLVILIFAIAIFGIILYPLFDLILCQPPCTKVQGFFCD